LSRQAAVAARFSSQRWRSLAVLQSACAILREMASFEAAGVSRQDASQTALP